MWFFLRGHWFLLEHLEGKYQQQQQDHILLIVIKCIHTLEYRANWCGFLSKTWGFEGNWPLAALYYSPSASGDTQPLCSGVDVGSGEMCILIWHWEKHWSGRTKQDFSSWMNLVVKVHLLAEWHFASNLNELGFFLLFVNCDTITFACLIRFTWGMTEIIAVYGINAATGP